jgi:hypothetical protein
MLDEDGTKWLSAARLIELLAALPADSRVTPNAVGNLLVLTADGAGCLAYVDFVGKGRVESMLRTTSPGGAQSLKPTARR